VHRGLPTVGDDDLEDEIVEEGEEGEGDASVEGNSSLDSANLSLVKQGVQVTD